MNTVMLKILILGGTTFLGPHLVEELHQRGHEVTLFNRGNQEVVCPDVEKLRGDREGHLEALKGRKWDAVIDTSGHLPRIVEASSEILSGATNHYTFVSTIGVYANFDQFDIDEEYPVAILDSPTEEITEKSYGALKAACENVIESYFPGRSLIVRPGLIIGPGDPTGRFTYWPKRIKEGGDILAPGDPKENVQFIDVRDLAAWIVDQVEQQTTGVYNVTGKPMPFQALLAECQNVTQANAQLHWVSEDFLNEHQVQDWVELPLWLSSRRKMPGFLNVSTEKASALGLTLRPLSHTIADILEWDEHRVNSIQAGLNREKEEELLRLWRLEKDILGRSGFMIGGIKRIVVTKGRESEFEQLFNQLRNEVKKNEPGNVYYDLYRSKTESSSYTVFERYVDQSALDTHKNSSHGATFFPKIRALLASIDVEYFEGI